VIHLTFVTPLAGLVALLGAAPLLVLFAVSDYAESVRSALSVAEPRFSRSVTAVAIVAVAILVGLAAAQPVLAKADVQRVRSDAEALFVIDTSRSMLASNGASAATRLDRAKAEAVRLRAKLPELKVGVASMTDRTLPHLFPSADRDLFRATVDDAVGIEQPPPIAYLNTGVTTFAALTAIVTRGFFTPSVSHRVAVVFTDGETRPFDASGLGLVLRRSPGVHPIFVHVWHPNELVYSGGFPEPDYQPDQSSDAKLEGAARAARGKVFGEGDLAAAAKAVRSYMATGPTMAEERAEHEFPLSRILLILAAVPLLVLLVRLSR
jgi:von Willebrand factor type A domain